MTNIKEKNGENLESMAKVLTGFTWELLGISGKSVSEAKDRL